MRQLLKFGHSMIAIAFLGAIAVLWVLHQQLPDPDEALSLYAAGRQAMERIAVLLLLPSLVLSLLFGLFSMAMVTGFHNAPWAWARFVTTVVMLEGERGNAFAKTVDYSQMSERLAALRKRAAKQ